MRSRLPVCRGNRSPRDRMQRLVFTSLDQAGSYQATETRMLGHVDPSIWTGTADKPHAIIPAPMMEAQSTWNESSASYRRCEACHLLPVGGVTQDAGKQVLGRLGEDISTLFRHWLPKDSPSSTIYLEFEADHPVSNYFMRFAYANFRTRSLQWLKSSAQFPAPSPSPKCFIMSDQRYLPSSRCEMKYRMFPNPSATK